MFVGIFELPSFGVSLFYVVLRWYGRKFLPSHGLKSTKKVRMCHISLYEIKEERICLSAHFTMDFTDTDTDTFY